jgi:hypothetical protein
MFCYGSPESTRRALSGFSAEVIQVRRDAPGLLKRLDKFDLLCDQGSFDYFGEFFFR